MTPFFTVMLGSLTSSFTTSAMRKASPGYSCAATLRSDATNESATASLPAATSRVRSAAHLPRKTGRRAKRLCRVRPCLKQNVVQTISALRRFCASRDKSNPIDRRHALPLHDFLQATNLYAVSRHANNHMSRTVSQITQFHLAPIPRSNGQCNRIPGAKRQLSSSKTHHRSHVIMRKALGSGTVQATPFAIE